MARLSHPTWVRGLKLLRNSCSVIALRSHPTWVRGLKLNYNDERDVKIESHPTWVRGLKRYNKRSSFFSACRTLRGCVD